MTTTETTETGFTLTAQRRLRMAEATLKSQHEKAVFGLDRNATYAADWNVAPLVEAETEYVLYLQAAGEQGELRFAHAVARLLTDSSRSTDAFTRATAEAKRTGALRALRALRGEMSAEAQLELVDQL